MTVKIYLAHYSSERASDLASKLSFSDVKIVTHRDFGHIEDDDSRTDARLDAICESDLFVYLAPRGNVHNRLLSELRNTELGIAIGAEVPLTFIGPARNGYQRFGDVFETTEEFVEAWRNRAKAQSIVSQMSGVSRS